jgi:uncharacterized surface protein with fasciclin (FAS1) repeats
VFNDTFNNVSADTLLKVLLNTNKTGQHDLRYNWHIVESGIQPQQNWSPSSTLYLTYYTFNNVSGITYDMLASFIGINATVNNISAMIYNMAFSFISV